MVLAVVLAFALVAVVALGFAFESPSAPIRWPLVSVALFVVFALLIGGWVLAFHVFNWDAEKSAVVAGAFAALIGAFLLALSEADDVKDLDSAEPVRFVATSVALGAAVAAVIIGISAEEPTASCTVSGVENATCIVTIDD